MGSMEYRRLLISLNLNFKCKRRVLCGLCLIIILVYGTIIMKCPGLFNLRTNWMSTKTCTWETENECLYDIMNMPQIKYNNIYKNPCWYGRYDYGPLNDGKIHCLPYFYILGVKKSGTSDMFKRITKHPDVADNKLLELQWLPRVRFDAVLTNKVLRAVVESIDFDKRKVGFYAYMFKRATSEITSSPSNGTGPLYFKKIVGDKTPAHFYMHTNWALLPGNEGLTEPKYTNFHYLKHLSPNAKIIMIFRDPISRMFSDFRHNIRRLKKIKKISVSSLPQAFHQEAVVLTSKYQECFRHHSYRACVYNETLQNELKEKNIIQADSFTTGIYEIYMRDVYDVFDKNKVLPILSSEYNANTKSTLSKVFDFLGLDQPSKRTWRKITEVEIRSAPPLKKEDMMLNETKRLMADFFKPFNSRMASLMNDDRFNFS